MENMQINNSRFPVITSYPMIVEIDQAATESWTSIKLPNDDEVKEKMIIGAFIIKQNEATNAKKKKEPSTQLPLLSVGAVQNAFLNVTDNCGVALTNFPIEGLLFDGCTHDGFAYTKLIFPNGISASKSSILIERSCLENAKEVLVIHWLLANRECCSITA